jgi:predicted acylesterase/phospholipase RssA
MADERSAVTQAKAIIAGADASPQVAIEHTKALHKDRDFGTARKMLATLAKRDDFRRVIDLNPALKLQFAQKRSLSTYKDPDLQVDAKYREALEILQEADPLDTSVNQETLGQAGAIHKRIWELDGRERQLETALMFYRRGYQQGVRTDHGYTGINAAFTLDLLADLETPDGKLSPAMTKAADERRTEARVVRSTIVETWVPLVEEPEHQYLKGLWWFLVTIGEAYFGLREYANAEPWLLKAAALKDTPDWEFESTARQLATVLRLQDRERISKGQPLDSLAKAVLSKFLGDKQAALDSVIRGKVGLALSGGGFRASLYHIGVLARLAELDLLRSVEYLSCVSGGSIIGAHYYLEIRRLLQSKPDLAISRQDYIDIVQRVCDDFLDGVQRNIRTRIAAEWLTNMKMILLPNYSRTMRAGDLYESEIFARVRDEENNDKRWLNKLLIHPKGEVESFRPKDHNWRRAAKVPILVLNATCLNTGHNWQFTASWMGEPPAGIDSEVDANYRLRRMYYSEAPEPHKEIRLGHAVAASACVPGLFEPLSLANLYERTPSDSDRKVKPIVRLVDGGVYDNQGVAALLEQGCSVLLVSDASGQMSEQDKPSSGLLGVPLRSNSILQARVRVSEFEDLDSRRRGGTLKGLMFVHLKKGLPTRPVDWIDTQDPSAPQTNQPMLKYGVQASIQKRIAAIRTDLDSFSDTEAYALMVSGYKMTAHALHEPILGFDLSDVPREPWKFMELEKPMESGDSKSTLQKQLKVADKLAFKIWFLSRRLQVASAIVAVVLVSIAGFYVYEAREEIRASSSMPLFAGPTLVELATYVGYALLSILGLGVVTKLVNYRKTLQQILIGLGMGTVGFLFARLHLHVFDRLFLRYGRVRKPAKP